MHTTRASPLAGRAVNASNAHMESRQIWIRPLLSFFLVKYKSRKAGQRYEATEEIV
ncbi:hypothetical protein [Candidatus Hydrogenosomobacter endosymbioticus]|nr:hypothetical protein [Candidatus Hydrogenosomobacter endosymbioticus]